MGKLERIRGKRSGLTINPTNITVEEAEKIFSNNKVQRIASLRTTNSRPTPSYPFVERRRNILKNNKSEFLSPKSSEYPVPSWFKSTSKEVDVSIIVPLFKSSSVILEQIESWDLSDDGLKKEIIYVDDRCPLHSKNYVIKAWEKRRRDIKRPIGKIIEHDKNAGFGPACNTGAYYSNGKYLLFLNADCTVTRNWINPMVDLIKSDSKIGIVGNLQIKKGKIESAGSEWSWESKSFVHIGRTSYKGVPHSTFELKNAPNDLLQVAEREMVTGCCFIIPRNLFMDLEGFDTAYRIGYWEDADLCMRVKSNGYKIYYQPNSVINHEVSHSRSGSHPFKDQNQKTFSNKWVNTGRLDTMVKNVRKNPPNPNIKNHIKDKVYGCVIVCNEEEFLEASVDSISSIVDEWLIVVGGNKYAYNSGMCDERGYPTDSTLEIAKKLVGKYGGKVIEPPGRCWEDKIEMRAAYAKYLKPRDWMFMLDGDEVYKQDKLWRIVELMKSYDVLIMQFWLFWNDMWTLGTGSWRNYPQERVVRWKPGFGYYTTHLNVEVSPGKLARGVSPTWKGEENMFYHYSWVRPIEKIKQKMMYYKLQTGNKKSINYVEDIFLKWRENPSLISYTHPLGGGGWKTFEGIHPEGIQLLIDSGKLNF